MEKQKIITLKDKNGRNYNFAVLRGLRATKIVKQYLNSNLSHLEQCYNNYSSRKNSAYDYCRNIYNNFDGEYFTITGYNSNYFSVAFEIEYEEKNYLIYITYADDYIIEL